MNSNSASNATLTSALGREWQALRCALTFLTRIPLPARDSRPPQLAPAAAYFPAVGIVIASLSYLAFTAVSSLLPHTLACGFTLITALLLTGAFHEDGLADTADGLGGGWQREDKLRIMKDSRLGTYGSVALFSLLALKLLALIAIPAQHIFVALLLGHTLGRWSTLPLIHSCNYVGTSTSDERPLIEAGSLQRSLVASAITLCLVGLLAPALVVPILAASLFILVGSRWYLQRQIGGITGDTLGAVNQLVEVAVYLIVVNHYTY